MIGEKIEISLQQSIPVRILFGKEVPHEPFWHEAEVLGETEKGLKVGFYFSNGSLLHPKQKYFTTEVNNKQYREIKP